MKPGQMTNPESFRYYAAKKSTYIRLFLLDILTYKLTNKDNSLVKSASLQAYFTPPDPYIQNFFLLS